MAGGLTPASRTRSSWPINLVLEELPYTPAPENSGQIEGASEVSHRVLIGRNSRIIDSVIRGPVIIGKDTIIRDSYVGPYTVAR